MTATFSKEQRDGVIRAIKLAGLRIHAKYQYPNMVTYRLDPRTVLRFSNGVVDIDVKSDDDYGHGNYVRTLDQVSDDTLQCITYALPAVINEIILLNEIVLLNTEAQAAYQRLVDQLNTMCPDNGTKQG